MLTLLQCHSPWLWLKCCLHFSFCFCQGGLTVHTAWAGCIFCSCAISQALCFACVELSLVSVVILAAVFLLHILVTCHALCNSSCPCNQRTSACQQCNSPCQAQKLLAQANGRVLRHSASSIHGQMHANALWSLQQTYASTPTQHKRPHSSRLECNKLTTGWAHGSYVHRAHTCIIVCIT